jgi:hypothetical protein
LTGGLRQKDTGRKRLAGGDWQEEIGNKETGSRRLGGGD